MTSGNISYIETQHMSLQMWCLLRSKVYETTYYPLLSPLQHTHHYKKILQVLPILS